MSNQIISWSMLILPWLTLFFMERKEIKHYLPVGLFSIVLTTIIHDIGITFGFWVVEDAAYPFYEMLPYFYGLIPVLTMWVFKFTYGRFWLYIFTNAILDIGFAFFLLSVFFPGRGIYTLVNLASFQVWLINLGHGAVLYVFQILLEGNPVRLRALNLQPASTKPSCEKEDQ